MDIELHYIEKGKGEPFILLHGNGEDSTYFVNQLSDFAQEYHVYAIDTRGHGNSPRGNAPFTISQFADDLKNFMDMHGIASAHILGFSDGGNIGLTFAMRYPSRVKSLILNGANLTPAGVKRTVQIPIVIGYRIAMFFSKFSRMAKRNAEMLALMVEEPNIDAEELNTLRIQSLVIVGKRDMIKEKHSRLIASHLPLAELVFLRGDHFIAFKKPEKFNKAVLSFLRNHSY